MSAKLQVLVIDDDAVVGRSFDRVLSDKGYEVSTALSGEEALETLENSKFDVVFTDIKMPGMDGLEVTERIKARSPLTPVVVITGYGTQDNEIKASGLGASGFVRKPLTPEMIENITLKAVNDAESANDAVIQPIDSVEAEVASDVTVTRQVNSTAKNIGLFFASPFIALGYVIALPFVGMYMFAKLGREAFIKKHMSE